MSGVGETVARLSQLRRKPGLNDGAPAESRLMKEVKGFGFNPGALRMFTYVPAGVPRGAPLVVVLHGCTQDAESHAASAGWLTLADRLGFVVLAPEQVGANNPNRCFNWFAPEDTCRGGGEAASIRAMVARCTREHGLDPERVFVTGLSAGGAMAAVMLATYPDVFSAGAVVAGLPFGGARNVQEALARMSAPQEMSGSRLGALVRAAAPEAASLPRVAVWHGDLDRTVKHRNGGDIAQQWASAHGLSSKPDAVEMLNGRVRSTWRSPDGEALVELNLVHGLGHGVPLASSGEDGLGHPGPYMLEAGVSAAMEIARFWKLAPPAAELTIEPRKIVPAETPAAAQTVASGVGETVMAALGGRVAPDVQSTIERALRRAGLMP